jgi:hypothetical protein
MASLLVDRGTGPEIRDSIQIVAERVSGHGSAPDMDLVEGGTRGESRDGLQFATKQVRADEPDSLSGVVRAGELATDRGPGQTVASTHGEQRDGRRRARGRNRGTSVRPRVDRAHAAGRIRSCAAASNRPDRGYPFVANPIAPVVAQPAIAFGDCDRAPTPGSTAAVTRYQRRSGCFGTQLALGEGSS